MSQRVAGVPERVLGGIIPPKISHPVVATGDSEAVASFRASPEGWEIVFCVYTMISLNSQVFLSLNLSRQIETEVKENRSVNFSNHKQWNHEGGWKNTLNNLRLIVQPLLLFWLIYPWLDIFPNSDLLVGLNHLISAMNQFKPFYSSG